jgi:large subunit ribosomal protein L23
MKNPYEVIKSNRVTEKATGLSEKGQYVFKVDPKATKQDIAYAVETIFKKKVACVNTLRVTGKTKRTRFGTVGRKAAWKKAIVTLKAGEKLELV